MSSSPAGDFGANKKRLEARNLTKTPDPSWPRPRRAAPLGAPGPPPRPPTPPRDPARGSGARGARAGAGDACGAALGEGSGAAQPQAGRAPSCLPSSDKGCVPAERPVSNSEAGLTRVPRGPRLAPPGPAPAAAAPRRRARARRAQALVFFESPLDTFGPASGDDPVAAERDDLAAPSRFDADPLASPVEPLKLPK